MPLKIFGDFHFELPGIPSEIGYALIPSDLE